MTIGLDGVMYVQGVCVGIVSECESQSHQPPEEIHIFRSIFCEPLIISANAPKVLRPDAESPMGCNKTRRRRYGFWDESLIHRESS